MLIDSPNIPSIIRGQYNQTVSLVEQMTESRVDIQKVWLHVCRELDKNGLVVFSNHFERWFDSPPPYHMEHILCL